MADDASMVLEELLRKTQMSNDVDFLLAGVLALTLLPRMLHSHKGAIADNAGRELMSDVV